VPSSRVASRWVRVLEADQGASTSLRVQILFTAVVAGRASRELVVLGLSVVYGLGQVWIRSVPSKVRSGFAPPGTSLALKQGQDVFPRNPLHVVTYYCNTVIYKKREGKRKAKKEQTSRIKKMDAPRRTRNRSQNGDTTHDGSESLLRENHTVRENVS
jgi:hypothetical protein